MNDRVTAAPIGLHLRSTFRTSWRSLLAIAVLFGVTAGLSLAALASARRTSSGFDRLLEASRASDLSIDYGSYDPKLGAALAGLPGVASSSIDIAFNAAAVDEDNHVRTDFANDFETVGSLDGRFFDQDQVVVLDGRLPDPTRADEVMVNESTAKSGVSVGDQLTLGLVTDEELYGSEDPDSLVPGTTQRVTVVGEILFLDEVIQDDNDVISRLVTTPAFTAKYVDTLATYAWQGLRLQPGTKPLQVAADARKLLAEQDPEDPGFTLIRSVDEDRARVDRAVLPQVSALLIISALVAVVALLLGQQAAGRQIGASEPDLSTYRGFGLGPGAMTVVAAVPVLLSMALGAVLAVAVAAAASPLSPFGALHRAEADPGIQVDVAVVVGGAAALALLAGVGGLVAARLAGRRVARVARTLPRVRRSRLAAWTQAVGAPVSVSVGAGYALQPQSGPQAAPVRTIAAGAAVAITALVAALCFGSSLNRLVDNPPLYGWNWDAAAIDQAGYGSIDLERAAGVFDADPDVEGWAPLAILSTSIDGRTVPVVGVRPDDVVGPAVLSGRMVRTDGEIVLGRSTLKALDKNVGDTVLFGEQGLPLRIVGTATLPAIGQVHSSHPSPGEGAVVLVSVPISAAEEPAVVGNDQSTIDQSTIDQSTFSVAAVRLRTGSDKAAALDRLRRPSFEIGEFPGSAELGGVARPAEIINARSTAIAPTLTAGMLTLTAMISLSLALVAAVRRRRTDIAALKAIGFTRRQVGATILTQSIIVTTIGIVIGTPLGIVAGRWLWARFAERMSVVNSASVPVATLAGVILVVAVTSLLVAVAPSQIAAGVQPGDSLRRD